MSESKIYILIVEDEPNVLTSVARDLEIFEDVFPIEIAESAEDAREVIQEIHENEDKLGLVICDHILPGTYGADFLIELQKDEETKSAMNVLLTGQAGLDDTIKAINEGGLKHFIAKPWQKDELIEIAKKLLTDFVIENEKDLLPFMRVLDQERIAEEVRNRS